MEKQPEFSKLLKLDDIDNICSFCPAMECHRVGEDYNSACYLYDDEENCKYMNCEYIKETFDIIRDEYEQAIIKEEQAFDYFFKYCFDIVENYNVRKVDMQYFTPFSNGQELLVWKDHNCNLCKRYNCSTKYRIDGGYITLKSAEKIGITNGRLNNSCNQFLDKIEKKKQVINEEQLFKWEI